MTTVATARPRDRVATATTPPLPPPGPAWFPVVMGTGILSALLATTGAAGAAGVVAARCLLVLGWVAALGLTAGWAAYCRRHPGSVRTSLLDPAQVPAWGTVSMGLLSIGAASLAVLPGVEADLLPVAVAVDLLTWVVGTTLGLATTVRFAALLLRPASRGDLGRPTPVWGLPVVPPMVSATVGAVLAPHLPAGPGTAILVVSAGCFVVALTLGAAVFALSYLHHASAQPLPVALGVATWIPLGIVGQSMAAAQAGAAVVPGLRGAATAYGVLMLVLAVPVVTHAARATVRTWAAGTPFAPGWWALTFPLGTLALGAHLLGTSTGWSPVATVGTVCLLGLAATWTFCAVASLRAVPRSRWGAGWGPADSRIALRGLPQGPHMP